jgi:outer membrane protein TolC
MKKRLIIALIMLPAFIQAQDILDEYVGFGLENNLALKQKYSGYLRSLEALREARGLFYPNVYLGARYTVSEGGRVINFPVGQMLNPVYSTLNALTSSNSFTQVENMEIKFLRPTEHETRIRLAQPVFNPDIYYNSKIRKELTGYEEADFEQYKRELVAEIKKSYFDVAMAEGILSTLIETRKLLVENVRVNKKLVENDKVTRDILYRSEAELSKMDQDIQRAEKGRRTATAYFNFLLNKSLGDSVLVNQLITFPLISDLTEEYTSIALENREEIKKLQSYSDIADLRVKMGQSERLPDMFIAFDYGYQGEKYKFNKDYDYMQASAVLSWKLFSGFQTNARIKQSKIDKTIIDTRLEETRKQIELQVLTTLNELLTAEKGITAAETRLMNAKEGFRLMNRKYEEGQASLIEFLDARTNMTQAELNLIISRFTYLSSYADLEKVTTISKYQ